MATEKVLKIKVDAETKKALKGMKDLQKQTVKNTAGFKKMGGTIMKFVGAAVVLKGFKDITKAAIKQENSIKALNVALKNTGESFTATQGGIDAMSKNLQKVAAEIQQVTTVGDEASMEVMQLGLSMGVSAGKIGEATKQAIGLSKAYKMDLRASIKMVALAHAGDFNMLQRYIPQLKLAKTTAEKKAIALKAMADGYKVAKGEAETFGGKMTQLGNTFGDFKERLGAGVTQNESFMDSLDGIKKTLEDPAITEGLANIVSGITTMAAQLVNVIGLLGKGATAIRNFGGELGTSFGAFVQGKSIEQIDSAVDGVEAQFNDLLVTVMKTRREFGKGAEDFKNFDRVLQALRNSSGTYEEKMVRLQKIIRDTTESNGDFANAYKETREEIKKNIEETNNIVHGKKEEVIVTDKATEANKGYAGSLKLINPIQTDFKDIIIASIPPIKEMSAEEWVAAQAEKDLADATERLTNAQAELFFNLGNVFGALTRLGGPLGDIAGGFANVAGDVGNLIKGLGGGAFGLKDLPNAINLGISAFQALGPVLKSVGKAIGGFFDMWGDSEWKKLLRSTNDETNAVWDMINTFGMTPGVIDVIKRHLDKLPAGFEATRRALEQLLIDAGVAEKGMKGAAARPALEPDAGDFKPGTDTPVGGFDPSGGGGDKNDFVSAASGFSGVLKRDTVFKAHKGEPVNITPKNQANSGMGGGMGGKIDNRRFNTDITNMFNITDAGIIGVVARAMRTNAGQLKRITKEELKLT
jgi:hypothetical protein